MAQIRQVVSESLQATIRRLLPSQQGFTEDLQATNVITPIIDLTPSAEGSLLGTNLQTALNFGGATAFDVSNANTTIANTPGFWRVTGLFAMGNAALAAKISMTINDGTTDKILFGIEYRSTNQYFDFDKVIFLDTGESLIVQAAAATQGTGSVRQIADKFGELVNPVGFVSQ